MSFGKTLVNECGIERELNLFLEYLATRLSLDRNEVFKAMRDYKNKKSTTTTFQASNKTSGFTKVAGTTVETSGIQLDNTQVKPRGQGSTPMPFFEGPVKSSEADRHRLLQEQLTSLPDEEVIEDDGDDKVVSISRHGDRYNLTVDPKFLRSVTNGSFSAILKRKTLSEEEYNYLKQFLRRENVNYSDNSTQSKPKQSKLTNVEDIMKKVQEEMNDDERLSPDAKVIAKSSKQTKLKLVKLTTNTAWDKDTKYVFRLNRGNGGKMKPVAFAVRQSREADNEELSDSNIEDLKSRGLEYDLSFSL